MLVTAVRSITLHCVATMVIALVLSSCSTTDFAALQVPDEAEATARVTSPWPSHAGPGSSRFTDVALISKEKAGSRPARRLHSWCWAVLNSPPGTLSRSYRAQSSVPHT